VYTENSARATVFYGLFFMVLFFMVLSTAGLIGRFPELRCANERFCNKLAIADFSGILALCAAAH
jgi:hypothetical protein